MAKAPATLHGDRKVYSVSAFNGGVADWVARDQRTMVATSGPGEPP